MKTLPRKMKPQTRFVAVYSVRDSGRFPFRLEVHQQEYGNRNYVFVNVDINAEGRAIPNRTTVLDGGETFTVFTKDDSCGRGEYAEEIDVQLAKHRRHAGSIPDVKRIAEAVLKAEYEDGLRISKVVSRFGLF